MSGAEMPDAESAGSASADPADSGHKRERGVAATARAAIDAMRRGVVAYTALTE